MNPVDNIANAFPRLTAFQPLIPAAATHPRINRSDITDTVDFSHNGTAFSLSSFVAPLHFEHIVAMREAIENDTFETPERIEGTVNRLIDLLA